MKFVLAHSIARERALEAVRAAPVGWWVSVTEPQRNKDQNALLHALLTEIAGSRKWDGMTLDVEDWKRLLVAGWMKATNRRIRLVRAIDGEGFDILYQRTSTLTKAECSELIDFVTAWHATEDR